MIKNFNYNEMESADGKFNNVSLFEAIQQAVRTNTDGSGNNLLGDNMGGMQNNTMLIGQFVPNSGRFNINAALGWAKQNCLNKSIGRCAKYVRLMLNAGGINTAGNPVSAYQYASFLPKLGFKHIASIGTVDEQAKWTNTNGRPGDIAVMAHGQHGHICMYTGYQWVSDFVQRKMWPYAGNGVCNIFRFAG